MVEWGAILFLKENLDYFQSKSLTLDFQFYTQFILSFD